MKIRLHFKTPDVVSDAIERIRSDRRESFNELTLEDALGHFGLTCESAGEFWPAGTLIVRDASETEIDRGFRSQIWEMLREKFEDELDSELSDVEMSIRGHVEYGECLTVEFDSETDSIETIRPKGKLNHD